MIHKLNDSGFYVIFDACIVVNFMSISGVYFCCYIMPGLIQPVAYFINTFSIFTYRILIAADVVNRKICRHFFCLLCSDNYLHHLYKIEQRLIGGWFGECIKRIFCMIFLYIRVGADPFISDTYIAAALTHPAQKFSRKLRIRLFSFSVIDCLLKSGFSSICTTKDSGSTADGI